MNFVALNAAQHRDLRFTADLGYTALSDKMLVPLAAGEVSRVAREGVLVKPKDQHRIFLLAGIKKGKCAYITDSGHWQGRYVPAMLRQYPFRLADGGDQRYEVQFDADAPHWTAPGGEPLFTEDGTPAPLLERLQKVLVAVQQDLLRTQVLTRRLDEAGLWKTEHLTYGSDDHKAAVTGIELIDAQRLAALTPDVLHALHASGALAMAFAVMMARNNLSDGVLAQHVDSGKAGNSMQQLFNLDDVDWGRLQ